MVVDGHRKGLFGVVLSDAVPIEVPLDVGGLGHGLDRGRRWFARLWSQLFIEHILAQNDAVITDVDAGSGDQLFYFRTGLTTETAQGDVGRAGHRSGLLFLAVDETWNLFT